MYATHVVILLYCHASKKIFIDEYAVVKTKIFYCPRTILDIIYDWLLHIDFSVYLSPIIVVLKKKFRIKCYLIKKK